jgi:hypothetical protein
MLRLLLPLTIGIQERAQVEAIVERLCQQIVADPVAGATLTVLPAAHLSSCGSCVAPGCAIGDTNGRFRTGRS